MIPTKNRDEVKCPRNVGSSCSNSGTCDAILVTNPVISHERGKDRIVIMTNGTHPWSFGYGGDRKTFEMMTSN